MPKVVALWRSLSQRVSIGAFTSVVIGCFGAGPAWGQTFSDNFNRTGPELGSNWVTRMGEISIVADSLRARPNLIGQMTVVGFDTTAPLLSVDMSYPQEVSFPQQAYVGLLGRYADAANTVRVTVNSTLRRNRAEFDLLTFNYGTVTRGWDGMTGGDADVEITPFTQGRLSMSVDGSTVTAFIDTNFDGTPEHTFSRGGLPLTNLGTGVGIAMFGSDIVVPADNFSAVPEPGTPALGAAAAGLLAMRRRRVR